MSNEPAHVQLARNELAGAGGDSERAKAARKRLAAAGVVDPDPAPPVSEQVDEDPVPAARSLPPQGRRSRPASSAD